MNWRDIEEIAQRLEDQFEQEELPQSEEELKEMVLSLDEFEGGEDDEEADQALPIIIEHWIEVRNHKY